MERHVKAALAGAEEGTTETATASRLGSGQIESVGRASGLHASLGVHLSGLAVRIKGDLNR